MKGPRGRALVRAAWTAAVALLAILFLKIFVCDVKRVESGSMEPTIFGSPEAGESVLVLYGAFQAQRFDCVVIARGGEEVPMVKRVVGLPRESVQIANGDLLIDGVRLPPDAPRPPPVAIYDSRLPSAAGGFVPAAGKEPLWTGREGGWELDASGIGPGSGAGLLVMHRPLADSYLDPHGALVRGEVEVNDAVVECELRFREPRGRVILELAEQGDRFRFTLEANGPGAGTASLARLGAGEPEEVLVSKPVAIETGSWIRLRASNVDNALAFEVADAPPLCSTYPENRFDPADHLKEGRTFGPRASLGGESGGFEFRSLRVLRDIAYTARGSHGVSAPAELGPDEYFVLGDHSTTSRDSREWGPVQASWIVGRPVWVVWPPSRIRRIPAAAPGPCGR